MKKIISFITGIAAGTVLSTLYAQRSGKDLRQRIKNAKKTGNSIFQPLFKDVMAGRKEAKNDLQALLKKEGIDLKIIINDGQKKLKSLAQDINSEGKTIITNTKQKASKKIIATKRIIAKKIK